MTIPVTAFTTAICALLLLLTALNTVRQRLRLGAAFGDAGDDQLIRASRAHGNLAEHAPIVLLMMAALELAHANHQLLMGVGVAFIVARISHIVGMHSVSTPGKPPVTRQIGVTLTWLVIAGLGAWTALMLLNSNFGR